LGSLALQAATMGVASAAAREWASRDLRRDRPVRHNRLQPAATRYSRVEALSLCGPLDANRQLRCAACHPANGSRAGPGHVLAAQPFRLISRSPLEPASTPRQHSTCPQDLAPVAASSLPPDARNAAQSSRLRHVRRARHPQGPPSQGGAPSYRETCRFAGTLRVARRIDSGPDGNRRCSVVLRQTTEISDLRGFSSY
jgi:hypothetical protein